ncbi:MAG: hypothetical protein ASARMPREDX12_003543 [Alectoria sarmentosa]|nr:MAG: hypothetical protein ASARMPREDX12_003543 [Alectoria sarmentosa]
MASNFLQTHVVSSPYSRIDQEDLDEELLEKGGTCLTSSSRPYRCYYLLLSAMFIAFAAVAGYLLGSLNHHAECESIFQYNSSFAAPPPKEAGSEPVWDSMIPNGLGYIKDPTIARETSVLSAFHQLHCLYTIRRAFYSDSATEDGLEAFDLGKERKPHVAHCFDYLRQGILCSADSSIEPAVDTVNGFLGAGFPRQCRDFKELKDWAEEHRAFDAHGFLVEMEHE